MNQLRFGSFIRVDKRQAQKLWDKGKTFFVCASNLIPFGGWHHAAEIDPKRYADENWTFHQMVANFEAYNCTERETGYYAAFYAREEAK